MLKSSYRKLLPYMDQFLSSSFDSCFNLQQKSFKLSGD